MSLDYKGYTALVTGSTRGIGQAIADRFVELGGYVLQTGTNQNEIDRLNKNTMVKNENRVFYCVDFTSKTSTNIFIDQISLIPKIDVLINNAGINRLNFIQDSLISDWDSMLAVNLTAPYLLIKQLCPRMIENQYGRIINIGSIFGSISREKRAVYSACKFGLHGLTVGVSNDLARYNILVNTISPGFTRTELTEKNLSSTEMNILSDQIPTKRFAVPGDIANVVAFIASNQNTYITGQDIITDGGFTNV